MKAYGTMKEKRKDIKADSPLESWLMIEGLGSRIQGLGFRLNFAADDNLGLGFRV